MPTMYDLPSDRTEDSGLPQPTQQAQQKVEMLKALLRALGVEPNI